MVQLPVPSGPPISFSPLVPAADAERMGWVLRDGVLDTLFALLYLTFAQSRQAEEKVRSRRLTSLRSRSVGQKLTRGRRHRPRSSPPLLPLPSLNRLLRSPWRRTRSVCGSRTRADRSINRSRQARQLTVFFSQDMDDLFGGLFTEKVPESQPLHSGSSSSISAEDRPKVKKKECFFFLFSLFRFLLNFQK